ncbi:MAG: cache domain-containing protein [Candidatus Cloacimonetes bacterium]|nr:cache domain-containing protein [Candidatus Cloacimonadota bacterium]
MKKIMILTILLLVFGVNLFAGLNNNTQHFQTPDLGTTNKSKGSISSFRQRDEGLGKPSEAKSMVYTAENYLKLNGKEKAFSQFMNRNSKFFYKDLYIFVIDMEGNVLAHGTDHALLGKNLRNLKDSTGKLFVQEFLKMMSKADSGWTEYKWRNYETHEIETKLTFLKKIDDNCFIGCGAYSQN